MILPAQFTVWNMCIATLANRVVQRGLKRQNEIPTVDTLRQKSVVTSTTQPQVLDRRPPTPSKRNDVIEFEMPAR